MTLQAYVHAYISWVVTLVFIECLLLLESKTMLGLWGIASRTHFSNLISSGMLPWDSFSFSGLLRDWGFLLGSTQHTIQKNTASYILKGILQQESISKLVQHSFRLSYVSISLTGVWEKDIGSWNPCLLLLYMPITNWIILKIDLLLDSVVGSRVFLFLKLSHLNIWK